ncbi:GNAT family N-acetyltransferase [Candidatus Poribacteria bacterium]|nr:GNAT family N-acetyltransferase [Candidatus Poribacteria bacterium]
MMQKDQFPVLDIGDYILREWRIEDAEDFQKWFSELDLEVTKDSSMLRGYSKNPMLFSSDPDEMLTQIRHQIEYIFIPPFQKRSGIYWAIAEKKGNQHIGTCHCRGNHLAEIDYFLARKYWNRGIMTQAVKAAVGYGFERMELHRIQAGTHPENYASRRVLEKVGFQYECTLRDYRVHHGQPTDSVMYSLLKRDWTQFTQNPNP